jgi:hypothetical protein
MYKAMWFDSVGYQILVSNQLVFLFLYIAIRCIMYKISSSAPKKKCKQKQISADKYSCNLQDGSKTIYFICNIIQAEKEMQTMHRYPCYGCHFQTLESSIKLKLNC